MLRSVCTLRDSVLCARTLLLHAVLFTNYIVAIFASFFISHVFRVLPSEFKEKSERI